MGRRLRLKPKVLRLNARPRLQRLRRYAARGSSSGTVRGLVFRKPEAVHVRWPSQALIVSGAVIVAGNPTSVRVAVRSFQPLCDVGVVSLRQPLEML